MKLLPDLGQELVLAWNLLNLQQRVLLPQLGPTPCSHRRHRRRWCWPSPELLRRAVGAVLRPGGAEKWVVGTQERCLAWPALLPDRLPHIGSRGHLPPDGPLLPDGLVRHGLERHVLLLPNWAHAWRLGWVRICVQRRRQQVHLLLHDGTGVRAHREEELVQLGIWSRTWSI